MNPDAEILIVIDPERYGGFYDVILEWIARELPEHRSWFTVQPLPFRIPDGARFSLMVPWLQDPVPYLTPNIYKQVVELTNQCDSKGIRLVNIVQRQKWTGKSGGSFIIGTEGLRAPKAKRIHYPGEFRNDFLGLQFPLFVREEFHHGGTITRADTPEEARLIPLHEFSNPTAIELIDLPQNPEGKYYKYRYVVAGGLGLPHHLQISKEWITRGKNRVINDSTQAQELAYINFPCRHHNAFVKAAQALGLDYLAFDYSIDYNGNPVVWEANPYPDIRYAKDQRLNYRNDAIARTHAVIVAMYFLKAGLVLPNKLRDFLAQSPSVQGL